MAHVYADLVAQYTETTGTGSYALTAAVANRRTFGAVLSNGDTTDYQVTGVDAAGSAAWEVGVGTYAASGATLARTTIRASSTGSAISWGPGVKTVTMVQAAWSIVAKSPDGSVSIPGIGNESLRVVPNNNAVNYAQITGGTTGNSVTWMSTGADAAVYANYAVKGAGAHTFCTADSTAQFQVRHTASANRYITLTGSNGGSPAIGTNGGSLKLEPATGVTEISGNVAATGGFAGTYLFLNGVNQHYIYDDGDKSIGFRINSGATAVAYFALEANAPDNGAVLRASGGPLYLRGAGGRINVLGIPTSSAGLASGDLWNDAGTLKIA